MYESDDDHDEDLDEDDDHDDNMRWEFPCLFTQPLHTDCWKESFAKKLWICKSAIWWSCRWWWWCLHNIYTQIAESRVLLKSCESENCWSRWYDFDGHFDVDDNAGCDDDGLRKFKKSPCKNKFHFQFWPPDSKSNHHLHLFPVWNKICSWNNTCCVLVMDQILDLSDSSNDTVNVNVFVRKTNNGERSNKCNQCDYLSTDRSNLRRH